MLVMAIVDGTRPASRRVWTDLQPTKCGMSGLRPTHSTFHRASRCHAGYEVVVMVFIDEFRVGAGQASQPARARLRCLSRITATADTNADERSATGQREGDGAGLRRDVRAWI